MHPRGVVYRFDDFELRPGEGLWHGETRVPMREASLKAMTLLVGHAPNLVTKEVLTRESWGGMASVNSLEQAIREIRRALGEQGPRGSRIKSEPKRGYRWMRPAEAITSLTALPAPHIDDDAMAAFDEGRRLLFTLKRSAIVKACRCFEQTLKSAPHYGPAHAGLATAYGLLFEGSLYSSRPDKDALRKALVHAEAGVACDPPCADAFSAAGFVWHMAGDYERAVTAARRAVAMEPHTARHLLRLAFICWGDDRLEAVDALLQICPGLAIALWLKATVLIARGAFDAALSFLVQACDAQDEQRRVDGVVYPAVGLHLLRGLVLAAQGHLREAIAAFEKELETLDPDLIFAMECGSNTQYAIGGVLLRLLEHAAAEAAFARALAIGPGHRAAAAALGRPLPAGNVLTTEDRIAQAVLLYRQNRRKAAVKAYVDAVTSSRRRSAGWLLLAEPLLHPCDDPVTWKAAIDLIRSRAI